MAQDFERSYASSISNSSGSPTTLVTSNSDDALISIRLVNKHTASVNASVIISSGGTDFNVIKNAPIPDNFKKNRIKIIECQRINK